jgi:carboxypeptidase C (cathepsin A)
MTEKLLQLGIAGLRLKQNALRPGRHSLLAIRRAASALLLCILLQGALASAQEKSPTQPPPKGDRPTHAENQPDEPVPPAAGEDRGDAKPSERTSVTHHDITVAGKTLHYTATAGTLLIRNEEDKPYGSIFYVAYTLDGPDAKTRPVTFLYNGGPGSASLWLHMGSVGPMRVITASPAATGSGPYQLVPNEYTLLDKSDLVFIDAPLTGYSRLVGKATNKDFAGVDPDLKAFARFIERYLTVNQRWNSPKFLFGESYGTTRSAGLSAVLQEDGVQLNGIVLLSSVLNYYRARAAGMDLDSYNLPSYAAIAWYYKKVAGATGVDDAGMRAFVEQARVFAAGEYAQALAKGDTLTPAETDAIAAKLSQLTGLSTTYIKEAKLRIAPTRFRKELLRDEGDILGRYDARFEGTDYDNAGENPSYDPSDTGIGGAFVSTLHDYLSRDLKYESTDEYRQSAGTIGEWDWHHRAAGSRYPDQMPDTAIDLADTMRKNPKLKVLSANGWFDLATPFFGTEYDVSHMMLTPALAANVTFTYYPSGHMVYLNVDALKAMRHDLDGFYASAMR